MFTFVRLVNGMETKTRAIFSKTITIGEMVNETCHRLGLSHHDAVFRDYYDRKKLGKLEGWDLKIDDSNLAPGNLILVEGGDAY